MSDLNIYREIDCLETTISNIFIDEYLADANDAQIKVYLYLIRMAKAGHPTCISSIADKFNHTEKDVCRALKYWEKKSLLSLDYDANGTIIGLRLFDPVSGKGAAPLVKNDSQLSITAAPMDTAPQKEVPLRASDIKSHYSTEDIKRFRHNEESSQIIFLAENYLKRTLSANDVRSLLFYLTELGFSVDLIDFLLQFCIDLGKTSFSYIDKVAIDWAEHSITTIEQARSYVSYTRAGNQAAGGQTVPSGSSAGRSSYYATSRSGKGQCNTAFHQLEQNNYDFNAIEAMLLK